jgi:hypothetical protein
MGPSLKGSYTHNIGRCFHCLYARFGGVQRRMSAIALPTHSWHHSRRWIGAENEHPGASRRELSKTPVASVALSHPSPCRLVALSPCRLVALSPAHVFQGFSQASSRLVVRSPQGDFPPATPSAPKPAPCCPCGPSTCRPHQPTGTAPAG